MADRLFSEINEKTLERYENALESVSVLAGTVARMNGMATVPTEDGMDHPGMEMMFEALAFYDYLFSTYLGYDDGSFIQMVAVRNEPEFLRLYGAPSGTFYVLRIIAANSEGILKQRDRFFNRQRNVIGERDGQIPDYDPRARPWYIRAQKEEVAFFSQPYIFSAAKIPGITCAEKLAIGGAAFGADITLDRFSVSLEQQKISQNGLLFLFDYTGRIIAGWRQRISGGSSTWRRGCMIAAR